MFLLNKDIVFILMIKYIITHKKNTSHHKTYYFDLNWL